MSEVLFKHIAQMQYELNENLTPSWTKAGIDWDLIIITECEKALESLPKWKWWKAPAPDNIVNLKAECIDMLHTLLSKQMDLRLNNLEIIKNISTNNTTTHLASNSFFAQTGDHFFSIFQQQQRVSGTNTSPEPTDLIKAFLRYSLVNDMTQATRNLFQLLIKLKMSADDIYREYMAKCILTHYRNLRGYSDPDIEYEKVINDKEDGDHVIDILYALPGQFLNLDDLKDHIFI